MYEEAEGELGKFLTPAKDGRDMPVSRSGRFTPGEKAPGTHWIRVWARLKAGREAADDNLLSLPGNETRFLGHPTRSLVTEIPRRYSITVCGTSCKSTMWLGCCQITRWM